MLVIVTSHWKEDLTWLKQSKFPVVLIDKEGSDPSCFTPWRVIPNRGGAESVYFKFIIENYDNLPDHVAFIHGHENSHHQNYPVPLLQVIESANLEYGYIPLNGCVRFYSFFNEEGVANGPLIWDTLHLPQDKKPKIGQMMISQPASQFIVSRERILANSKEFYEHIYNVIMTEEPEFEKWSKTYVGKNWAYLEHVIHVIFGEPLICFHNPNWFRIPLKPIVCVVHPEEERKYYTAILDELISKNTV